MTLKELCNKYDIEYDSKHGKLMRNKISQYCEYIQRGKDYQIVREYTEQEVLALTSSKFADYITDLLIKQLSLSDKNRYSFIELFECMGMVNDTFRQGKNNLYNKKTYYEIPKFTYQLTDFEKENDTNDYQIIENNLYRFFTSSTRLMKEIVRNALNSAQKNRFIFWKPTYRLYKIIDDDNYMIHECTTEEAGLILAIENKGLELVGYKHKWFGYNKQAKETFESYVNQKIKEVFDCDFYIDAVDLTLAQDTIRHQALKIDCKYRLNKNVENKLLTSKEMDDIISSLNKQFIQEYIAFERVK